MIWVVAVDFFFSTKDLPTASGITLRVLGDVTPALTVPIAVESPKDVKVSWRTRQSFLRRERGEIFRSENG